MDDRTRKAAEALAEAALDVIHAQSDLDEVHTKLRDAVLEYDKAAAASAPHNAQ